jgi:hypothetical protein
MVTFTPTTPGSFTADVSVADNEKGSLRLLALSGTGAQPGISFSPTSLSFGSETVGKKSGGMKVTVVNIGTVTLTIDNVALTGTYAVDYSFTTTCGASLLAGKTCTVTVFFDPQVTRSLRQISLSPITCPRRRHAECSALGFRKLVVLAINQFRHGEERLRPNCWYIRRHRPDLQGRALAGFLKTSGCYASR